MTLAKATVTGTVYRTPETRFTQNDIAISSFSLKLDERDEILIRVISKRKSLSELVSKIKVGDRLMVDGRLQTVTAKTTEGVEKKYYEIDANDIELMPGSSASAEVIPSQAETPAPSSDTEGSIVGFTDFAEEELIDSEEIPF